MDTLLELKTNILTFIEKNERWVKPASKLVMMLFVYLTVYFRLGFFGRLHNIMVPVFLSAVCSVTPTSLGCILLGLYILINLYGLGIEVALVGLIMLLLCYLLYLRFARKQAYIMVLTPILSLLRIPYVLPVAVGLTSEIPTVVSVLMGTVVFYFFRGIKANEAVFLSNDAGEGINKIGVAISQFTGNVEMWLMIGTFLCTTIIVYVIRRMRIKNAWRVAIYAGSVLQLIMILGGKLVLLTDTGIIGVIVGSVISVALLVVLEFFLFNLDYTRVENVQFEDDNYYYYVMAVPKTLVKAKSKRVTTFNETKQKKEEIESESLL